MRGISAPITNRPSGSLYLGTDQLDLIDSVPTFVLLDTVAYGFTDGIENTVTHRITPVVPGFYFVKAQIQLLNPVISKRYRLGIKKNIPEEDLVFSVVHASIADRLSIVGSNICYLDAGDFVYLHCTSFAGVNTVDIDADPAATFLTVQRIR